MTLIIGLKCSGGVVIGADSAATFAHVGRPTSVQTTAAKIHVIGPNTIAAFSGAIGLSQLFESELDGMVKRKELEPGTNTSSAEKVRKLLTQKMWPHVKDRMEKATIARHVTGQAAINDAICTSLIATPAGGETRLFQFTEQCDSEEATASLPYACIGSGQPIADPFVGFLRHVFWRDRLPTVAEGTVAVYWALKHSIHVSPGGVAGPIQMATLTQTSGKFMAKELTKDELKESDQAIAAIEDYLRGFYAQGGQGAETLPNPK